MLLVIRLRHRAADSEGIPLVMRDTIGFLQENGRSFSQVRFMAQPNLLRTSKRECIVSIHVRLDIRIVVFLFSLSGGLLSTGAILL